MATDDLNRLVSWADALLASMTPAARRQLMGELARNLRISQSKRIRANIQPDGSPMTPRKPLNKPAGSRQPAPNIKPWLSLSARPIASPPFTNTASKTASRAAKSAIRRENCWGCLYLR